jgi:hypothetical protein
MTVAFFDSREPFDGSGRANVDRVYQFDWTRFGKAESDSLDRIYRALPGWIGYASVPYWFGDDEQSLNYLTASVEPPGLQVVGNLSESDFQNWHARFLGATRELPALQSTDP